MSQVHDVQVTVTHTEGEALILENTLIKTLKPRYNVLLRDDKSYPYLYLSTHHEFPRLSLHRGSRSGKGRYFGPYPSAHAVHESLHLLQKVFRLRQCEDSFFRNRSRPCLQYQIKRCSGPCVGLVTTEEYEKDVRHTVLFLQGKSGGVIDELVRQMEQASAHQHYETAARYRDQIGSLRRVQERQYVSGEAGDLDIVACVQQAGTAAVQVFFIRAGRNLGNKIFFPRVPKQANAEDVLGAFIAQYYPGKETPAEILVNLQPDDDGLSAQALAQQAGHSVSLRHRVRGERARWLQMAVSNAEHALSGRLSSQTGIQQRLAALQQALGLEEVPGRIECFDISHTQGEATVASCVVFNHEGAAKSDYRRFNIKGITPGDDYAAMCQAMTRRYLRVKKGEAPVPDMVIIDGGKGQLSEAQKVMQELLLSDIPLLAVAKGAGRRAGKEKLFLSGHKQPFILPASSPALHLIQQIRDEAHRFAISGHRQRRARSRKVSVLEAISGLGPKRRRELLRQFGGIQGVKEARIEDLARVNGISRNLAEKIYLVFHEDI
jgi:excinuclease ABC subunit C